MMSCREEGRPGILTGCSRSEKITAGENRRLRATLWHAFSIDFIA